MVPIGTHSRRMIIILHRGKERLMRLRSDRYSILWFSQNHYYLVFFWSVGRSKTVDILQSRSSGRTGFDTGERYDNNYNYMKRIPRY